MSLNNIRINMKSPVKKRGATIKGPGTSANLNLYYNNNNPNSVLQKFINKTVKMNAGAFMQTRNRDPKYNFSVVNKNTGNLLGVSMSKPANDNKKTLSVELLAVESHKNNKLKERIPGLTQRLLRKVLQKARANNYNKVNLQFVYPNPHRKTNIIFNNKLGKELGFPNMAVKYLKKPLDTHRYNMKANRNRRINLKVKGVEGVLSQSVLGRNAASVIAKHYRNLLKKK